MLPRSECARKVLAMRMLYEPNTIIFLLHMRFCALTLDNFRYFAHMERERIKLTRREIKYFKINKKREVGYYINHPF